jgi:hypothetical protein
MAERASAYFSNARKMQKALTALAAFDRSQESDGVSDGEKHHRREELFAEASEQAWFFSIQGEAMKLPFTTAFWRTSTSTRGREANGSEEAFVTLRPDDGFR